LYRSCTIPLYLILDPIAFTYMPDNSIFQTLIQLLAFIIKKLVLEFTARPAKGAKSSRWTDLRTPQTV